MKELFSYMWANVTLKLEGHECIRFMYLCSKNNLDIRNVQYIKNYYLIKMSCIDFYKIKNFRSKTGVSVNIMNKTGVKYLLKYIMRNKIAIIIAIISVVVVTYMSQLIWMISICGNKYLSDEQLMDWLYDNEVCIGKTIKEIDCNALENMMYQDFDKIAWVSIYPKGNSIIIDIREKIPFEEE